MSRSLASIVRRGGAVTAVLIVLWGFGARADHLAAQPAPPAQRPNAPPRTPRQSATIPAGATVSIGAITVTNQSPSDSADVTLDGEQVTITVAADLVVLVEGRTCAVTQTAGAFSCAITVDANASVAFDIGGDGRGVQRPLPPPVQTGTTARAAPTPGSSPVSTVPSGVSLPPVAVPAAAPATPSTAAPAIAAPAAAPAPVAPPVATVQPAVAAPPAPVAAVPPAQPAPALTSPGPLQAGAAQLPRTGTGLSADPALGPVTFVGVAVLLGALIGITLAARRKLRPRDT